VACLAVIPLGYVILRALGASAGVWQLLIAVQVWPLLGRTLALVASTVALASVIGVGLAWLVERAPLPGRAIWRWVLALPLAIPAYISAVAYLILFRRGGALDQAAIALGWERGTFPLPDIFSLGGATLVIGLSVYPYVYLPVAARLRSLSRSLDEAALAAGASRTQMLRRVIFPLLLPALASGALLVALYVLSDFGTVSMLRYRTFTQSIFNQFAGRVDRAAAAVLSLMLVALTVPLLLLESRMNRRERNVLGNGQWKPLLRAQRGWRRGSLAALAVAVVSAALALGVPLLTLGTLTVQAAFAPTELDRIWSIGNESIWQQGLNSFWVAGLSASSALAFALAPAYVFSRRQQSRLARLILAACKAPHALPGVIIGLAFVMLFSTLIPGVAGATILLAVGLALRLLPQSVTLAQVALSAVPQSLPSAARVMGASGLRAFLRVSLPVAAPGLLAGWTLLFVGAMKELPTALMLRPPGFDVLAVRVWAAASESVYTQAALPAFLLISITVVALALVYRRQHGSW
jgi:iron(III) transport system permease protein